MNTRIKPKFDSNFQKLIPRSPFQGKRTHIPALPSPHHILLFASVFPVRLTLAHISINETINLATSLYPGVSDYKPSYHRPADAICHPMRQTLSHAIATNSLAASSAYFTSSTNSSTYPLPTRTSSRITVRCSKLDYIIIVPMRMVLGNRTILRVAKVAK